MLGELREDNQALIAHMIEIHDLCDEANDVATASFLENWIDQAQRQTKKSIAVRDASMTLATAITGIVDKPSNHSVDETVDRLKNILQSKGITLFALVDHSGEAEKAGMKMPPTKLLIFGSPKAGTPLMLAAPSIAIDLPLKILVWEDDQKKTWVSHNSSAYLQERHNLPTELLQNIAVVETLVAKAAESPDRDGS